VVQRTDPRGRATARQHDSRGSDRRDLRAGRVAHSRDPLQQSSEKPLRAATTARECDHRRHEAGQAGRRRPVFAQRCLARQASLQVRTDHAHLFRGCLTVCDLRDQRREPLALGARLDPGDALQERAATLGEAAVDLRQPCGSTRVAVAAAGRFGLRDLERARDRVVRVASALSASLALDLRLQFASVVLLAEEHHESGRRGAKRVKRLLEATQRFSLDYNAYENPARVKLKMLTGHVERYDLTGDYLDEDGTAKTPIFIESKNVKEPGSQDWEFKRFLAQAYSATKYFIDDLGTDPEYEFMWATTCPWKGKGFRQVADASEIKAAVEAEAARDETVKVNGEIWRR
jgi:hypothetical protein